MSGQRDQMPAHFSFRILRDHTSDDDVVTYRLQRGENFSKAFIQPWREIQAGVLYEEVKILVSDDRKDIAVSAAENNEVAPSHLGVISGRKLIRPVRNVLLRGAENNDADGVEPDGGNTCRLFEKASNLLEMA